ARGGGGGGAVGGFFFGGEKKRVVRRLHTLGGGGASPPATSISCSQHRRAAGPYKPGRAARSAATAGFDTQDYNQGLPVARGNSGTVLRTRIAVARLHSRVPIHTHADGTSAPALRRRVASVQLTPWVPSRR